MTQGKNTELKDQLQNHLKFYF